MLFPSGDEGVQSVPAARALSLNIALMRSTVQVGEEVGRGAVGAEEDVARSRRP